jgi:hypothetical protein
VHRPPRGVAPASAIGVAIGLALPLVALNQTGTGNNDAEGLALLIAAAALVLNAREEERAPLVLAAVALGLAVGTKLSLLAPAVAMALALLVAEPAGKRRALAGPLLGAMLLAGFYWYARNLVRTGNPHGVSRRRHRAGRPSGPPNNDGLEGADSAESRSLPAALETGASGRSICVASEVDGS